MSDLDADTFISRLQAKLATKEVRDYLRLARNLRHGVRVELYLLPDGNVGAPRISVETRGDKRLEH